MVNRIFIFLITTLVVVMPLVSLPIPEYDGSWWQGVSKDERDGFVSGYFDCYIREAKKAADLKKPVQQDIADVNHFYARNPNKMDTPVADVLNKFAGPRSPKHVGEQQGVDPGDYWRQMSHEQRDGFVRGYIDCKSTYLHAKFLKPIDEYVSAISKWYGVSDQDESELNDKTANDKIGDVLARLDDQKVKE